MNRIIWCCVVASFFYSCGNNDRSTETSAYDDAISGVYVREYSREILHQSSGNKMGMRTVRDTLYIEKLSDGYKVENSKWRMNDYDDEGWQDMQHGESGPLPDFEATYDEQAKTLSSTSPGVVPSLHIKADGKISVGDKTEIAFAKID